MLCQDPSAWREVLTATAKRLQDNYPYFHPLYAGQMLKPPHPVAQLAYALAMTINPNNHALDGGRATSAMEKEAVAQLAQLCLAGRNSSAICVAVERWPTWKLCGWPGSQRREKQFWLARNRTTPTSASAKFCNYHSKRLRPTRVDVLI